MSNILEEYSDYCKKNGLPDSIAGFVLWNAWKEAEARLVYVTQERDKVRQHCEQVWIEASKEFELKTAMLQKQNEKLLKTICSGIKPAPIVVSKEQWATIAKEKKK